MRDDKERCLRVKVEGGYLCATIGGDDNYPGIWVEFIADNDHGLNMSRPTVLMEKPVGEELRALIWDDKDNEDYTREIIFK